MESDYEWLKEMNRRCREKKILDQQIKEREKKEQEELESGKCIRFGGFNWVEYNYIWTFIGGNYEQKRFSALSNETMQLVLEAQERRFKNKGVMGFFRRMNRKMNGPVNREFDMTN